MIIRRVRAHPFGSLRDTTVDFQPGLNVVLGPNEAGKSTLFKAVRHVLLARTTISKKDAARYVLPYLPASGGDSISVEMEIAASDGLYTIRRRWGAGAGSELVLPTKATLSDEPTVILKIEALLPAKAGTVSHILMTQQSELPATVETLRKDAQGSLDDLADTLRRAVLETGGVSVDRFLALVKKRRDDSFSRWNRTQKGPERGRGIANPWTREVGAVLAAWYAAERARAAHAAATKDEIDIDAVNARIRQATLALAEVEAFVTANTAAARDARERGRLEAELEAARKDIEMLRRVARDWPVAADAMERLCEDAGAAQSAAAALDAELAAAQAAEAGRGLREKHARVARKKAQLTEAETRLAAAPRLSRRDIDEVRRASLEVEKLAAGLAAAALSVTVAARRAVDVTTQEDFSPEARRSMQPGDTVRLGAGSRVRVVHPDLEVEVRSGDAGAEARAEALAAARRALDALCARLGVKDPADAEEKHRVAEALAADAQAARRNLDDELGGESLAAIEARVSSLGPETQSRPVATISAERATARAKVETCRRDLGQARGRIDEWTAAFGSQEKLEDKLLAAKARETTIDRGIGAAAPLPAGFADAASFLGAWEKAERDRADRRVELTRLEGEKRNLEDRVRDQSSAEELAVLAKDAKEVFAAELRRAEALDRIVSAAESLAGADSSSLYDGLRDGLEKHLSAMRGREARLVMEGALPAGLAGPGESPVGWELLSAGTKDLVALALRLAMAEHFLGDADGFLLMDDPLVDMDPARQTAAAAALKEFAGTRQLILFTCHPSTADLLGGNLVRI